VLYFTPIQGSPGWCDLDQIWHSYRSHWRNDLCKLWLWSVEGWALCGCTKFAFSQWLQWLALQQANTNVLPWYKYTLWHKFRPTYRYRKTATLLYTKQRTPISSHLLLLTLLLTYHSLHALSSSQFHSRLKTFSSIILILFSPLHHLDSYSGFGSGFQIPIISFSSFYSFTFIFIHLSFFIYSLTSQCLGVR
jgi:hypothetical protein